MDEGTDMRENLNYFNTLLSQLICVKVIVKEEDKAWLLLLSIPGSYHSLAIMLLVYTKNGRYKFCCLRD